MEAVRRPPAPHTAPSAASSAMSEYVTVVAVGAHHQQKHPPPQQQLPPQPQPEEAASAEATDGFVTVLTIGDAPAGAPPATNGSGAGGDCCVEQVLVYRLPGERLGFGLKFEGGTKAAEFVKRLFIQSCAPDSPASRVRGTWGALSEGDEVLAIDNARVTSMTRIDCVRCLKDSNVVIKLQVRHWLAPSAEDDKTPLVIGAEKKRTAPPPPPVPPRKGPRKKDLHVALPPNGFGDVAEARNARHANFADGAVVHPPDAEVYMDLFSQECTVQDAYCLSESDDTGSSISTVVDRFGSFPTTTTSSFAGSMPSTPTAVQRRIQHAHPFGVEHSADEGLLFERLASLQAKESHVTLQPPASFQDAPLSYADEDVRVVEAAALVALAADHPGAERSRARKRPPPPPPPRTKHLQSTKKASENQQSSGAAVSDAGVVKTTAILETVDVVGTPEVRPEASAAEANNNDVGRADENAKVLLPRLVDFVPKSTKSEGDGDASTAFIAQEQMRHTDAFLLSPPEEPDDYDDADGGGKWSEDGEAYAYGWSSGGQPLATIGEADNEHDSSDEQRSRSRSSDEEVPTTEGSESSDEVDGAVESMPNDAECKQTTPEPAPRTALRPLAADVEQEQRTPNGMDTRQPPDGHEFPDYHQESPPVKQPAMAARRSVPTLPRAIKEPPKTSVKNMIAMFSHNEEAQHPAASATAANAVAKDVKVTSNSFDFDASPLKRGSMSDLPAASAAASPPPSPEGTPNGHLHARSQSLVDISSTSDRWSQILDQRRRGLSKLKGLIIPEHPEMAQSVAPLAMVDLPEIKSAVDGSHEFTQPPVSSGSGSIPDAKVHHSRNNSSPSINLSTASPWGADVECGKYSPAFKRKTLQVCAPKVTAKETTSSSDEECRLPSAEAPKSLESITSPTRSDCSFEYASMGSIGSSPSTHAVQLKTVTKSEDESDNDSAVSSSQSSYISRQSPPASPNHLYDPANRRMLKAQSVEAINRKNILASAKCRSGKDLNGSPLLIQRKFDETDGAKFAISVKLDEPINVLDKNIDTIASSANHDAHNNVAFHNGASESRTRAESKETKTQIPLGRAVKSRSESKPLSKIDIDRLTSKFLSNRSSAKSASVTDLRKNFENASMAASVKPFTPGKTARARVSSISGAENAVDKRPLSSKRSSLPSLITATKAIDIRQVVDATVKFWQDEGVTTADMSVITLRPEIPGGSIGITLAGGTDYETKDITIHKVRNGSVAHRDGRLSKGERVLSINGKSMNSVTHAESMSILKEPVSEVIIVTMTSRGAIHTSPSTPIALTTPPIPSRDSSSRTLQLDAKTPSTGRRDPSANATLADGSAGKPIISVKLIKDALSTASGLGFSMEGGRGSPQGDVPLLIKKLFTGGLADKSGMLAAGDEIVEIQGTDVTGMPRIDAWSLMKKLPPGEVTLKVRR